MSSHLLIHQKSYKATLLGFLLACLGMLNISLAQSLDTRPTLQELLLIKEQLTKQSMAGDHKASARLGAIYLSGSLGMPDYIRARKYLKLGSDVDLSARLAYGHLLMNGLGGSVDKLTAEHEFRKASEAGSNEGLYLASKLMLSRSSSLSEKEIAFKGIINTAESGFPPAIFSVAEFYRTGSFVKKDSAMAEKLFLKSASRGFHEGYSKAAEMNLFGELGEIKKDQAVELYRLALSKGVISSSYPLAYLLYYDKQSTEDHLLEAFRISETAALSWDGRCQYLLGLMYYEGKATDINYGESLFWLELAASAGVFESHHLRSLVSEKLSENETKLTRARAYEWFQANHDTPHKHLFIRDSQHVFP